MPVGAMIFLGVVLAVFTVLDIFMLVTLLKPGDERNQIIVWKASSFTLLGVVGANILTVIEKFVTAQPLTQNPFVQLEVFAIMYFVSLMYYKRNKRKELGLSQEELAKKCGVSRQTVNAIENNKYDPTLALAFCLAKELQITVDELFIPS